MNESDLILLVLDAHKGIDAHDRQLLESVPKNKTVVVWNKIDIAPKEIPAIPLQHIVPLSAKSREES